MFLCGASGTHGGRGFPGCVEETVCDGDAAAAWFSVVVDGCAGELEFEGVDVVLHVVFVQGVMYWWSSENSARICSTVRVVCGGGMARLLGGGGLGVWAGLGFQRVSCFQRCVLVRTSMMSS